MNLTLNTNSLQSTTATSSVSSLSDLLNSTSSSGTDSTVGSASSTSVSKRGDFLAALKQLQQQDPAKFKEVVTKLASDVRDQAKTATGDQAKALNSFADKLDKVASTGDLSALKPHGGGHHAHGAKSYPPPPPPDSSDADGDGDGSSSSSATSASTSAASLKDQMAALLEKLTKEVTAATSSGASNGSTTNSSAITQSSGSTDVSIST